MNHNFRPLVPINQNGLDEVADALLNSPPEDNDEPNGGRLNVKADVSKYIQIGIKGIHGNQAVISPFELEGFGNLNYEQSHFKLAENGLYMPTPKLFMTYFCNVMDAFNEKRKLFYADGSQVPKSQIEDLYYHLIKNHKNVYGRADVGAWTWLNGKFVQGSGFNGFDLEHITGIDANGNLITKREKLEPYLTEETYVNLDFNSQGLPKSKSQGQNYVQGQNIKFWVPVEGRVARFGADSGWTILSCNRDPSDSGASLGVYACAEGAKKILGEAK